MRLPQFVAAILFILAWSPAQSAEVGPGAPGLCQLSLTGVIETGDLGKIEDRLAVFGGAGESTADHFLCLSGPGGNLAEALAIGQLLYDKGIGTRIAPGQSCLSACSVAFMMGTVFFEEGVGDGHNSNRRMDVTATLGFHRPSLKLGEDGNYSAAAVERSFEVALDASLELLRMANLGSRAQTMIPPDLIERMFSRQGQDFFYIDTVGQSARWQIGLDGFEPPQLMDPEAAFAACSNLAVWQRRYEAGAGQYRDGSVSLVSAGPEGAVYKVYGAFQSDAAHECLVQLRAYSGGQAFLYGCGYLGRENLLIAGSDCGAGHGGLEFHSEDQLEYSGDFDSRALLPPETPLTSANGAARLIEARAQSYLARETAPSGGRLRRTCSALDGPVVVSNVENFVNLRKGTGFGSAVLAEVPLGERLQPADSSIYRADASSGSAECVGLCVQAQRGNLDSGGLRRLSQCFDSNQFWYKVRTPGGEAGFISGKFLRY